MRLPRALAAALVATTAAAAEPVTAELKNGAGEAIGKVTLTAAPKGVLLRVEAKALTPGWHGLHFHEKADCSKSDFTSAGGHTWDYFNRMAEPTVRFVAEALDKESRRLL